MRTLLLSIVCFLSVNVLAKNEIEVNNLPTDYRENPIGIDTRIPRLSWEMVSNERGEIQTAYQIKAAYTEAALKSEKNLLWNTGKVFSDQSNQIDFFEKNLQSKQRIYWQVKVWDQKKFLHGAKLLFSKPVS